MPTENDSNLTDDTQQPSPQSVYDSIRQALIDNSDVEAIPAIQRFFKEETRFYGMKTAVANKIGRQHLAMTKKLKFTKQQVFELCDYLWASGYQEEALIACLFSESQVKNYQAEDLDVFERWLTTRVSNWAMCDTLCNHTVGDLLMMYPETASRLLVWAGSTNRWVKRAAGVSLIVPARKGLFLSLCFEIADSLLTDTDDLVQKGYGWMLKAVAESGDDGQQSVFDYVMRNKAVMPRTALRYAIEKMPAELKQQAMAR